MFVNSENYQDAKRYYEGCWIKVKECGDRIYTVDHVSKSYTDLSSPSRGEGDDEAEIRIDMMKGYTITYVIPKKTVYQHGEQALLLQRIPARMWRYGMDQKNTEFLTLSEKGVWKKIALCTEVIEGFINKPSYMSAQDAEKGFGFSLQSAALTPRIALTKAGSVFVDTIFVGKVREKEILFKKIFMNDLASLFPHKELKPV